MSDTPRTNAALRAVNAARQVGELEFLSSINDLAALTRELEREMERLRAGWIDANKTALAERLRECTVCRRMIPDDLSNAALDSEGKKNG